MSFEFAARKVGMKEVRKLAEGVLLNPEKNIEKILPKNSKANQAALETMATLGKSQLLEKDIRARCSDVVKFSAAREKALQNALDSLK